MSDKETLLELKAAAKELSLLYVEDNEGMLKSTVQFFQKFFKTVVSAKDGEEGLEKFQQQDFDLVITDLQMPHMNGFDMLEMIKAQSPHVKVIITSAHNERDQLHRAIKLGVNEYLIKPIKIDELTKAILEIIHVAENERNETVLYTQLHRVFNYQHNFVVMFEREEMLLANKNLLTLFGVYSLDAFKNKYHDLGEQFQEHDDFLTNTKAASWFKTISENIGKFFHVKLRDAQGKTHHLIVKMQNVPNKKDYFILSMDDVTELDLLSLLDKKENDNDVIVEENDELYKLLDAAAKNHIKINVHSFYKGLSITNPGIILEANEKRTILTCNVIQLKAMQYERNVILSSDLFPQDLYYASVRDIDFQAQRCSLSMGGLSAENATQREFIRIEPEEQQTVTLFYQNRKFGDEMKVLDISVKAVRIYTRHIIKGMENDDEINLDMVLNLNKRAFIIKAKGRVLKIIERKQGYELVINFYEEKRNKSLIDYVAKRQMALIREFKKMENSVDGVIYKN